jgi:hypothetical protein
MISMAYDGDAKPFLSLGEILLSLSNMSGRVEASKLETQTAPRLLAWSRWPLAPPGSSQSRKSRAKAHSRA